jgi:HSP20 family protein
MEQSMAIQRWDPLREVLRLQERMNRLFEEATARSGDAGDPDAMAPGAFKPATDLYELPDRYVMLVDLPGVAPADVEINVQDGVLVLTGERRPDPTIPSDAYLRIERPRGRFALQIALPPLVERREIEAKRRDGMLEVVLPKKKEHVQSKIQVEVK